MTQKKNKAVMGILIVVFLSFVLLMIFASYTMKNISQAGGGFSGASSSKEGSIAVVEVNGVIMESKRTIELIHEAEKDKSTKAIILRIDSPGGAVGPTQEIYEEIRRIDSKYETTEGKEGKPVYASFGSVAASGGYYLGAATRRIYTNKGTITGSIGVIMQFMDLSKLYNWAMVKQQNIKAGRYKDVGQPNRSMTEEEKVLLESMIAGVHDQFIEDIMKTREKRVKGDIKELAQGQIFSGAQAVELGLADAIGGLWQAGRQIHDELGIKEDFALKFIQKKKKTGLWAFMENLDEAVSDLRFLVNKASAIDNGPKLEYR